MFLPGECSPRGRMNSCLRDAARELDIGAITAHYEREWRGSPPGG